MPFLNGKQAEKKQTKEDKMTTELEKEFFQCFGIEHEERYYNCKDNLEGKCGIKCPCECCDKSEEAYYYPQITDKQYLELYCTLCDAFDILHIDRRPAFTFRVKDFKECVLKDLIMVNTFCKSEYVKHKVQQLFIPNP